MNETLEQLQSDLQASLDEMKAQEAVLSDEATSGDAFKEAKERFEAADARSGELATRIREIQSTHEMTRQREDARKAMAMRSEDAAKIRESLTRRPDMKATNPREVAARIQDRIGSASTQRDISVALATWSNYQVQERNVTSEQMESCRRLGVNPADSHLNLNKSLDFRYWFEEKMAKLHAYSPGDVPFAGSTDPLDTRDGQFAGILNRPPVQIQQLAMNSYSTNGVLKAPVTIWNTEHGDEVEQPYFDDMMNVGTKIGEGQSQPAVAQGNAGKITWRAYKYASKPVSVTWEMMRRSRYDLPELIPPMLGDRLGRATGAVFTTGSGGAGYPQGIVTFATDGGLISTCEAANGISVNDITYVTRNSVDHMFLEQNPEKIGWMMSQQVFAYLCTKKTGDGKPYYEMGKEMVNGRMVFTLEGYPIFINYSMPAFSWTAGSTLLLFGDFSKYVIRYAFGSSVPVLVRDDVSGISDMVTRFFAVQWVDARGLNYGNPPLVKLIAA